MKIKPSFVFETNLHNTVYKEFSNSEDVKKFIGQFNFTKIYSSTGKPITANVSINANPPVFKLGYRFVFDIEGHKAKTEIIWGPTIWVGRNVEKIVELPKHDVYNLEVPFLRRNSYMVHRFSVPKNEEIIVINPKTLSQETPAVVNGKTKIDEFLEFVSNQKMVLKVR